MPIINYGKIADTAKRNLLSNQRISAKNRELLNRFLDAYENNVSSARMGLFCKHIHFFAERVPDIQAELNNSALINEVFKELRKSLTPSYYETVKAVSIKFVSWVNDGEKPKSFRDIKNSKNGLKRNLKPSDMITWEEGLLMASKTNSIQMKAAILTQLDAGFRPSEFIDLTHGCCERDGKFIVTHVSSGKTGSRDVILYRGVPYLSRWLEHHPTKNPGDPLWLTEEVRHSKNRSIRYNYPAMCKRFRQIGKDAGITKPLDFYNFRHSACTLAKLDNLPTDAAAEKFGHSVKFFTETYGRLTVRDKVSRFNKVYGEDSSEEAKKKEEEARKQQPIICPFCNYSNIPGAKLCEKCTRPLMSPKDALSERDKLERLQKQVELIYDLIKSNREDILKRNMQER